MAQNLLFITVTVAALAFVLAGPGGHGGPRGGGHGGPRGGHGGPPFLQNVTRDARKEFEAVWRNETLTIAEIEAQTAALADKYGVSESYKKFEADRIAHLAEVKQNQTAVINNLSATSDKLRVIYQNKNQTRKAQEEAVAAIRKESPVEVDTIKFIRAQVGGEPLGHGHGGHGGPRGGPGGRGGPRGGGRGHGSH
ncbi:hypothetical protein CRE_21048 [Caenorhabditis remanei]|uniref:SXP/RAL-2 family protein Ani s 5-like cation-binding domain-containing protein n=1 Tax=Caenorhabditis remanei TaxID=31234 RepID=E3NP74_CAERE|nr:hypothetical protein CRE_21048 [Caenorhabditis remanei]